MASTVTTRGRRQAKVGHSILGKDLEAVVPDGHSLPPAIEDILRRIEGHYLKSYGKMYNSNTYIHSAENYFNGRDYRKIDLYAGNELECIIKVYFENIPGKLISRGILKLIPGMSTTSRLDSQLIKSLIESLPEHNWMALNAVLQHLAKVVHASKSSISDISLIFSLILVDTTGRPQNDRAHYYLLFKLIDMELNGELQQIDQHSYSIQDLDKVIGKPLHEVIDEDEMIPETIKELITIIEKHHFDKKKLYYKIEKEPKTLRDAFIVFGTQLSIDDYPQITCCIKLFIESIPGKLISRQIFYHSINGLHIINDQFTHDNINYIIRQLPNENRKVLAMLVRHLARLLQHSAKNQLSYDILGSLFCSLCIEKNDSSSRQTDRTLQSNFISAMIKYQFEYDGGKENFYWMQECQVKNNPTWRNDPNLGNKPYDDNYYSTSPTQISSQNQEYNSPRRIRSANTHDTTEIQENEYDFVEQSEVSGQNLNELEKENHEIKERLQNKVIEVKQLEDKNDNLERELKSRDKEIQELKNMNTKNLRDISEKEKEIKMLKEENKSLRRDLDTEKKRLEKKSKDHRDELNKKDEELRKEKKKGQESMDTFDTLHLKYTKLSDEQAELKKTSEKRAKDIRELTSSVNHNTKVIEQLNKDVEAKQNEICRLIYEHNKACGALKQQHKEEQDELQQKLLTETTQHQSLVEHSNKRDKNLSIILDALKGDLQKQSDMSVCVEALQGNPAKELEIQTDKVAKLRVALKQKSNQLVAANSELKTRKRKTQDNQLECLECKAEFGLMYDLQKHMIECIK